jgi:hypothetical protein
VVQVTLSQTFLLHYSSYGVWGDDAHGASHELLVSQCFFAEYMWGEPGFDNVARQNGTAIFLAPQFYDSNFYGSIIRCTRVGVVNMAGANLWHGMHIYSTCNKDPSGGNVSVGMLSAAWGQTRISSCYFDDSPLVVSCAERQGQTRASSARRACSALTPTCPPPHSFHLLRSSLPRTLQ